MKHFYHFIYPLVGPYELNTWQYITRAFDEQSDVNDPNYFEIELEHNVTGPFSEYNQALSHIKAKDFDWDKERHFYTTYRDWSQVWDDDCLLDISNINEDAASEFLNKFDGTLNKVKDFQFNPVFPNNSHFFWITGKIGPVDTWYSIDDASGNADSIYPFKSFEEAKIYLKGIYTKQDRVYISAFNGINCNFTPLYSIKTKRSEAKKPIKSNTTKSIKGKK